MMLFWCSWFEGRLTKPLVLVTVGKFCFHFSRVLGSVVGYVNVNTSAHVALNHTLREGQTVCVLTKVGMRTTLKLS